MLIKHESKQIWISPEYVVSLYYKEEATQFLPFFCPQNGKNDLKGHLNFFKHRRNDIKDLFFYFVSLYFYLQFCPQNLPFRTKNNLF